MSVFRDSCSAGRCSLPCWLLRLEMCIRDRYHWVRNYMLGRKARLVVRDAHRKEGRLLDLGTGTGYFADAMQRRGWQVEAVEKSAQARAFAKEHFNLEVKDVYKRQLWWPVSMPSSTA